MKFFTQFAVLLTAISPFSTDAATITQTKAFDVARAAPGAVVEFEFDTFDSAIGTLNAVSLTFSATNAVDLEFVCNIRPTCDNTEIRSRYAFFSALGTAAFLDANDQQLDLVAADSFPLFGRPIPFNPMRIFASRPGISVVSEQFELPLDGRFSTETGDLIGISLLQSVSVGSNQNTLPLRLLTNRVAGSVSLSYDFIPAPEIAPIPLPMGAWLLLSGLGLLLAPRLRKSNRPCFGSAMI